LLLSQLKKMHLLLLNQLLLLLLPLLLSQLMLSQLLHLPLPLLSQLLMQRSNFYCFKKTSVRRGFFSPALSFVAQI
jgi:hypothetical protein